MASLTARLMATSCPGRAWRFSQSAVTFGSSSRISCAPQARMAATSSRHPLFPAPVSSIAPSICSKLPKRASMRSSAAMFSASGSARPPMRMHAPFSL